MANGAKVLCSSELLNAKWVMDGHVFHSNLRVFPLSCYDLIIRMDWLERHSPMKVHWGLKWMDIPYGDSITFLQGILASGPTFTVVQVLNIEDLPIQELPDCIQQLLCHNSDVFLPPNGLPPSRSCDHYIPLIPGASPVSVRPYRCAPELKTEIKRHVADTLEQGIITHSTNPFSTSVILVKKKDGSWRFCVDYRQYQCYPRSYITNVYYEPCDCCYLLPLVSALFTGTYVLAKASR